MGSCAGRSTAPRLSHRPHRAAWFWVETSVFLGSFLPCSRRPGAGPQGATAAPFALQGHMPHPSLQQSPWGLRPWPEHMSSGALRWALPWNITHGVSLSGSGSFLSLLTCGSQPLMPVAVSPNPKISLCFSQLPGRHLLSSAWTDRQQWRPGQAGWRGAQGRGHQDAGTTDPLGWDALSSHTLEAWML